MSIAPSASSFISEANIIKVVGVYHLYYDIRETFVSENAINAIMIDCCRNRGMHFMLGPGWREYFKYIVVSARKPKFFNGSAPFRLYDEVDDSLSYEKVTHLKPGFVYAGVHSQFFE